MHHWTLKNKKSACRLLFEAKHTIFTYIHIAIAYFHLTLWSKGVFHSYLIHSILRIWNGLPPTCSAISLNTVGYQWQDLCLMLTMVGSSNLFYSLLGLSAWSHSLFCCCILNTMMNLWRWRSLALRFSGRPRFIKLLF